MERSYILCTSIVIYGLTENHTRDPGLYIKINFMQSWQTNSSDSMLSLGLFTNFITLVIYLSSTAYFKNTALNHMNNYDTNTYFISK